MAKNILLEIRETYTEPPYDIEDEQRAERIRNHFRDSLEKLPKEIQDSLADSMERDKAQIKDWYDVVLLSPESREDIKKRKYRSLYFEDIGEVLNLLDK